MTSWTLLHAAGLVALVVAALAARRFAKRPELEHLLWLLVVLKLVVPPFVEVPLLPAPAPVTAPVVVDAPPLDLTALDLEATELGAGATLEGPGLLERVTAVEALLALWAATSLLGLLFVVRNCARFHRFLRAHSRADAWLEDEVRRLAERLGLARVPEVLVVDAPITPALWPVGRVRLLFPEALLAALTPAERESVLLHELAHFARRDHWVRLPETLALCAWWWLPPVWWFRRELRFSEEACCDAHVVRALDGNPRPYAEALIKTAELLTRTASRPLPRFATGAHALQPLSQRIQKIMKHRSPGTTPRLRRGVLLAAGLALLPCLPGQAAPESNPAEEPVVVEASPFESPFESAAGAENPFLAKPKARPVSEDQEPPVGDADAAGMKRVIALVQAGDAEAALAAVNALRGAEANALFDFTAGNLLLQAGRSREAAEALGVATKKFPAFRRAWKNLGIASMQVGDHAAAAAALRKTIDLGGGDGQTYGLLGFCCMALERTSEAESAFWMANLLDPETRDWKLGLLRCFFGSSRHAEALSLCDQLLEETPADSELRKLKASALLALGRHAEAAEVLSRAAGEEAADLEPPAPFGSIRGRVLDADFGTPLADVEVSVMNSELRTTTDAEGRFVLLEVDAGARGLVVEKEGSGWHIREVRVRAGQVCDVQVALSGASEDGEDPAALEPWEEKVLAEVAALHEKGEREAAVALLRKALLERPSAPLRAKLDTLLAEAGGRVVSLTELDARPRAVHQPPPKLTAELRELPARTVVVLCVVDEAGRCREVRVQEPDPEAAAQDEAAVEAVEGWRFEPATADGRPVSFRMRVPITFPGQER